MNGDGADRVREHRLEKPPGPHGRFLGGASSELKRDPVNFFRSLRNYGPVAGIRLGPVPVYLVNDADLVAEVLKDERGILRKSWGLRQLRVVLGRGLLTDEGEHWRNARRRIKPIFRRERLRAYAEIMREEALAQAGLWRDGETLDIHQEISRVTLRIASRCFFSADLDEGAIAEIGGALTDVMNSFEHAIVRGVPLPFWLPLPRNRPIRRAVRRLRAQIEAILAARRGQPGGDLLGELLRLAADPESGVGERDVRDHLITFLLAGHETTALAVTWSLHCLGRNPDAERKLHEEVDSLLAEGEAPDYGALERFEWTREVVQEAMRLYPPAWGISRESRKPFALGGYRLRRHGQITMMQLYLHHDERYFDEPEAFRPERFAHELPPCARQAYFPFGGGPRVCIGAGFAMTEATLVLATLVRHWRFVPLPEPEVLLQTAVTLRPRYGVPMRLERRT